MTEMKWLRDRLRMLFPKSTDTSANMIVTLTPSNL